MKRLLKAFLYSCVLSILTLLSVAFLWGISGVFIKKISLEIRDFVKRN